MILNDDWAAAVSGDFHDASNWLANVVPNSAQAAVIEVAGPDFTVSSSGPATVLSLTVGSNATLDILDHDFDDLAGGSNAGLIDVAPGSATFQAAGVIDNSGVIELDQQLGGVSRGALVVGSGGLTLEGGGSIFLNDPNVWTNLAAPAPAGQSTDVIVTHASATLTNVDNTIYGAGQIGQGSLRIVNETSGLIDANLSFALDIRDVGGGIENDGLMESTGSGGLYVVSTTVDQGPCGVIAADGGAVYFSDADIVGGALVSPFGYFAWDHGLTTLDGTQGGVTIDALAFVSDDAQLGLDGSIANYGAIEVGTGQGASSVLIGAKGVRLTGDGEIVLGGHNPLTAIEAASSGAELINLGNAIGGQGVIGGGGLFFVNKGLVDASFRDPLRIIGHFANAGLLAATGAGGLTVSAPVDNAGGEILAGTNVTLDGATVSGGVACVPGSLTFSGDDNVSAAILGYGRLIEADGRAVLTDAGSFTGQIILDGGTLNITGAAPTGKVTFAGPATLELGEALAPGSTLSNKLIDFDASGDRLDLVGVAFVAGATAVLKGSVLTLSEGGEVYHFVLRGQMASTFEVKNDGHGGTVIMDDPTIDAVLQSAVASVSSDVSRPVDDSTSGVAVGAGVAMNEASGSLWSHDPTSIDSGGGMVDFGSWLNGDAHLMQVAELGSGWAFH